MTDSSNQEADAMPPDGVLLWTKRFPDGQLFQARRTMPFDIAIQTVEGVLAQIERETNGRLQCQPTKGLSQVRFTLAIEGGKKGLDIVIGNSTPGLLGWGYYTFPSQKEFRLWANIGAEVWKALDREMDKAAGLLLIDQQGWDAFEDTELELQVKVDGQLVDVPILTVAVTPPSRVAQGLENLLDFYNEVTEANRSIDEIESGRALPVVIDNQATAITPITAPERLTIADVIVGATAPMTEAMSEYVRTMTAPMTKSMGEALMRAVGLDEESFERAREKYAHQKSNMTGFIPLTEETFDNTSEPEKLLTDYPGHSYHLYGIWRTLDELCDLFNWHWNSITRDSGHYEMRTGPQGSQYAHAVLFFREPAGQVTVHGYKIAATGLGLTLTQRNLATQFQELLEMALRDIEGNYSDDRETWNLDFAHRISESTDKLLIANPLGLLPASTGASEPLTVETDQRPKDKRGKRSKLSKVEKIAAVKEWDEIDKDINPIRLDDWLERKFGAEGGVLNVAVSTFHGWRKLRD